MTAHRWLVVSLAVGIAAAAFPSCKAKPASTTGPDAGAGSGGEGGSGGASATGSGGMPVDAGPIVCLAPNTNIPKNGPCDLLNQDCPPGKTCQPVQVGGAESTDCVESSGLKGAGEDCYSGDECDAKLICIGAPAGKCVAFCCNDMAAEPCNGGLCITHVDFGNGSFAYVCSYGKRCTLLTPDACPPGLDCYVEDLAQGLAVCDDRSPTPVPELGACQFLNDCDTMQDCFNAGNAGNFCLYYCALSGSTTGAAPGLGGCPTGETCKDSYQGAAINTGVMNVGLCIPSDGLSAADAGTGGGGG
jgi:hypothetical protein